MDEMSEVQAYVELERARAIVIECCIKLGMEHLYQSITVEWEGRLQTTMGLARTWYRPVPRGAITLNPHLWARATDAQRRSTTVHEAAHILANLMHNKSCGHGPLWAEVMGRLGLPANRCHSVSTAGLRRKAIRYRVTCACGLGSRFTPQQRAQAMTGRKTFRCRCGEAFTVEATTRAEVLE